MGILKLSLSVNLNSFFNVMMVALLVLVSMSVGGSKEAIASSKPYFPVIGSARFGNDFDAPRASGPHHATDIFADKHAAIIAPVSGKIRYVISPQASWGYSVGIEDEGGYRYNFIHMNNDNIGTDDGQATEMLAYAADMRRGNRVEKGQLLGYVGDSGNAENTPPHLHFEIEDPQGRKVNPYEHLIQWTVVNRTSLYPTLQGEKLPYGFTPSGGLNVAIGDVLGDDREETITGAGISPKVKIYNNNGTTARVFFAYDAGFGGGIDVAAGDTDGDGTDEIITGPGAGGGPWVRIFKQDGTKIGEFAAFDPGFRGGIKVAAGDTDGDGTDEIITGPGAGGGPWVRIFKQDGTKTGEFAAFDKGFRGGIDVAAADTVDSTSKEVVVGAGPNGGPYITIFKPDGTRLSKFLVYDSAFRGGVRVSGGNVRSNKPKDEIMSIPASRGEPRVRLMENTGANIIDYPYLEQWWRGYYDVAAGQGFSKVGTGVNRRASLRDGAD